MRVLPTTLRINPNPCTEADSLQNWRTLATAVNPILNQQFPTVPSQGWFRFQLTGPFTDRLASAVLLDANGDPTETTVSVFDVENRYPSATGNEQGYGELFGTAPTHEVVVLHSFRPQDIFSHTDLEILGDLLFNTQVVLPGSDPVINMGGPITYEDQNGSVTVDINGVVYFVDASGNRFLVAVSDLRAVALEDIIGASGVFQGNLTPGTGQARLYIPLDEAGFAGTPWTPGPTVLVENWDRQKIFRTSHLAVEISRIVEGVPIFQVWQTPRLENSAQQSIYSASINGEISPGSAAFPTEGTGTIYRYFGDRNWESVGTWPLWNPFEVRASGECACGLVFFKDADEQNSEKQEFQITGLVPPTCSDVLTGVTCVDGEIVGTTRSLRVFSCDD